MMTLDDALRVLQLAVTNVKSEEDERVVLAFADWLDADPALKEVTLESPFHGRGSFGAALAEGLMQWAKNFSATGAAENPDE